MALIENKISIDDNSTKRIIDSISSLFQKFFNQPKWLIVLVVLTIAAGGCYFWYSHQEDKECIKDLQEQVIEINKMVDQNLGVEELIYIITEIKILEMVLQENFDERMYEMEAISNCINRYHPNDPAVADLKSIQYRMQVNKSSYNQHFTHVMNELDKIVAKYDSTSIN